MTITFGNAQVTIRQNNGGFYSVMALNGGQTVVAGKGHQTEAGAKRWANKVLQQHAG